MQHDAVVFVCGNASTMAPGVRAALVPVRTVGVQGDERSYSNLLALDGTLDAEGAGALARRITNEHRSINRVALVVYRRAGRGVDGLAIRPATLTPERIALLREADDLVRDADRFLALVETSLGLTEHAPIRVA